MPNNDIGNTDSTPSGVVIPSIPLDAVTAPPPSSTSAPSSESSTISASTSTSSTHNIDPGMPTLPPPEDQSLEKELAAFELLHAKKMREIAHSVLDKWLEGLREAARRRLEELRSPEYLNYMKQHESAFYATLQRAEERIEAELGLRKTPQYLSWVGTLNPSDQEHQRAYDKELTSFVSKIDAVGNYVERSKSGQVDPVNAVNLLAASYAIGTSSVEGVITVKELGIGAAMSASSFHEMWDKMSPQMNPEQRPDILGQIGALFMVQLFAKTAVETFGGEAAGKQAAATKNFSKEFAKLVIELVKGPEMNKLSDPMLAGKAKNPDQGVVALKVAMLSIALAYLYRSETGRMTPEEFDAMAQGKATFKEGDPKAELSGLISKLLDSIPDQKENLLDGLYEYMDNSPKVEQRMGAAANLYEKLLASMPESRPISA